MAFEITYLKSDDYRSTSDGVVVDLKPSGNWDVYSACDFSEEFGMRYYFVWGEKNLKRALRYATVWGGRVGLCRIYVRSDLEARHGCREPDR